MGSCQKIYIRVKFLFLRSPGAAAPVARPMTRLAASVPAATRLVVGAGQNLRDPLPAAGRRQNIFPRLAASFHQGVCGAGKRLYYIRNQLITQAFFVPDQRDGCGRSWLTL
jgi:hypothetical protein